MKVLFITAALPFPLDSGDKIKSFNTIKYLSQKHEIFLFSLIHAAEEVGYKKHLEKYCKEVNLFLINHATLRCWVSFIFAMLSCKPMAVYQFYLKVMKEKIDKVIKNNNLDLVYVNHAYMLECITLGNVKVMLDEHNIEWDLTLRQYLLEANVFKKITKFIEYRKLKNYEIEKCKKCDIVLTVSERDRNILAINGVKNIFCVPIGVDAKEILTIKQNSSARDIVFFGSTSWSPNIDAIQWFCKDIFPLVRQKIFGAKFVIMTKDIPRCIRKFAQDKNIIFINPIGSPAEYLKNCAAFIVPLRIGGGMRVKILNAMAWGLPVVSTSIGAEGISAQDDRDILIRDECQGFAVAIANLIRDKKLRDRLSENGRILVEKSYDWNIIAKKLDALLTEKYGKTKN